MRVTNIRSMPYFGFSQRYCWRFISPLMLCLISWEFPKFWKSVIPPFSVRVPKNTLWIAGPWSWMHFVPPKLRQQLKKSTGRNNLENFKLYTDFGFGRVYVPWNFWNVTKIGKREVMIFNRQLAISCHTPQPTAAALSQTDFRKLAANT